MAGVADLLRQSGLLENLKRRIDTTTQYEGDGESSYSAASSLAGNTLGSLPPRSVLGYAGLHNQGATCYLNSLLQALYCIPLLRKAFFEWEYNENQHGDSTLSVTRQVSIRSFFILMLVRMSLIPEYINLRTFSSRERGISAGTGVFWGKVFPPFGTTVILSL